MLLKMSTAAETNRVINMSAMLSTFVLPDVPRNSRAYSVLTQLIDAFSEQTPSQRTVQHSTMDTGLLDKSMPVNVDLECDSFSDTAVGEHCRLEGSESSSPATEYISDPDYVPEPQSKSSQTTRVTLVSNDSKKRKLSVTAANERRHHGTEVNDEIATETNLITVVSTAASQVGRSSDKRYYCLYCDRPYARLKQHLISQHAQESEVARMLSLADQKQAAKHLLKLRNLGNHKHNCSVLTRGSGSLIVVYRPRNVNVSAEDYVPCPQCYGYYAKSQLYKHRQERCVWKNAEENDEKRAICSQPDDVHIDIDEDDGSCDVSVPENVHLECDSFSDTAVVEHCRLEGSASSSPAPATECISDPDYVPEPQSKSLQTPRVPLVSNDSKKRKLSGTDANEGRHHGTEANDEIPTGTNLIAVVSTAASQVGRSSDKRYYCLYCDRPYAKIKQHLIPQHAQESEVARMLSLADQKQAAKHLLKLRNLGNHKHNCSVLTRGSGSLIVVYRPRNVNVSAEDYVPCPQCYGYYAKSQLYKHRKERCVWKNAEENDDKRAICSRPHDVHIDIDEDCESFDVSMTENLHLECDSFSDTAVVEHCRLEGSASSSPETVISEYISDPDYMPELQSKSSQRRRVTLVSNDSKKRKLSVTAANERRHHGTEVNDEIPIETNLITVVSTAASQVGRSSDKRYYCLYCDRPYARIKQHLIPQHAQESEVARMLSLADQKQAAKHLLKLRNLGNHKHNCSVLTRGSGSLIVVYRPRNVNVFAEDYVPCPQCYGYYAKSQLYKHRKERCVWKTAEENDENRAICSQQSPYDVHIDIDEGDSSRDVSVPVNVELECDSFSDTAVVEHCHLEGSTSSSPATEYISDPDNVPEHQSKSSQTPRVPLESKDSKKHKHRQRCVWKTTDENDEKRAICSRQSPDDVHTNIDGDESSRDTCVPEILELECDSFSDTAVVEHYQLEGSLSSSSAPSTECISDPDYVPEPQSESSQTPRVPLVSNESKKPKLSVTAANEGGHCGTEASDEIPTETNLITVVSTAASQVHRTRDKRYYCLYCDRPYAKIKRHLISQHAQESEVARMLSIADQKQAAKHLLKLRNLGNHKHNCSVLTRGSGSLIVVYRPTNVNVSAEDYIPCPQCYGYYAKPQMWRHRQERCVWTIVDENDDKRAICSQQSPDDVHTDIDEDAGSRDRWVPVNVDSECDSFSDTAVGDHCRLEGSSSSSPATEYISDPDYVPEPQSESSQTPRVPLVSKESKKRKLSVTAANEDGHCGIEANDEIPTGTNLITVVSTTASQVHRTRDKRYYCLYCDRPYAKIKPHLISQHADESDVAGMLSLADKKQAAKRLVQLRNLGNHKHNCSVLTRGSGSFMVVYRPTNVNVSAEDYIPCPQCYGYYAKPQMWRHRKQRCVWKIMEENDEKRAICSRHSLDDVHTDIDEDLTVFDDVEPSDDECDIATGHGDSNFEAR